MYKRQIESLTRVATSDDACNGTRSRVSFQATSGVTYRIAVDGFAIGFPPPPTPPATGAIALQISAPPAPGNDSFALAVPLPSTNITTSSGSNVGASAEAGEPMHSTVPGGPPGALPGGASIWWRWTPPISGSGFASTCGSAIFTFTGVYTGASVNALANVINGEIECDDGSAGSTVSFPAVAGQTYRIAVDGDPVGHTGRGLEAHPAARSVASVVARRDARQRFDRRAGVDREQRVEVAAAGVDRRGLRLGRRPLPPDRSRVGRAAEAVPGLGRFTGGVDVRAGVVDRQRPGGERLGTGEVVVGRRRGCGARGQRRKQRADGSQRQ